MDLPNLESIAEASVTLAGFAAVFRAFAAGSDPDGHSAVRLNVVIEGGLVLAFVCFLPSALQGASFSSDTSLRVASAVAEASSVLRGVVPGAQIVRAGRPLPELFPFAIAFGVAAILAFFAGALGALSSFAAHQLGAVALFGTIAVTFIGQFRVERRR